MIEEYCGKCCNPKQGCTCSDLGKCENCNCELSNEDLSSHVCNDCRYDDQLITQ